MVIACSDSRVDPQTVFGAAPGELFVVRNVAALVPPYQTDSGYHGTSAALEFGVKVLKVARLVVLGHGQCGGVRAMAYGAPPQARDFIASWVEIGKPARSPLRATRRRAGLAGSRRKSCGCRWKNLYDLPLDRRCGLGRRLGLQGHRFDVHTGVLAQRRPGRARADRVTGSSSAGASGAPSPAEPGPPNLHRRTMVELAPRGLRRGGRREWQNSRDAPTAKGNAMPTYVCFFPTSPNKAFATSKRRRSVRMRSRLSPSITAARSRKYCGRMATTTSSPSSTLRTEASASALGLSVAKLGNVRSHTCVHSQLKRLARSWTRSPRPGGIIGNSWEKRREKGAGGAPALALCTRVRPRKNRPLVSSSEPG